MKTFLLPIALLTSIALNAQQPSLRAPHGGEIARSGEHCIEMLLRGDEACFYLLDTLGQSVDAWGGMAYFHFADKSVANLPFEPRKEGGFRVVLSNPNAFTVVPSFKTGTGFVSAEFNSGPRMSVPSVEEQHNASDGHQH